MLHRFRSQHSSVVSRREAVSVRRKRFRPDIEVLEDRVTPAITVTTTADIFTPGTFNSGSLRDAINQVNAGMVNDNTIILPAGTYKITLPGAGEDVNQTGDFDISHSVTIQGAGAATTIIDGGGLDRVFDLLASPTAANTVNLSGLTIQNGLTANGGGGIRDAASVTTAAGTAFGANLTLTNCVVANNHTSNSGGGILTTASVASGTGATSAAGGVATGGSVTLIGTIVRDNSAGIHGGGISTQASVSVGRGNTQGNSVLNAMALGGSVTLMNSTVTGNTSTNQGGGIHTTASPSNSGGANSVVSGNIMLTDSVVSNNTAQNAGGGISTDTDAPGTTGTATVGGVTALRSIISGNTVAKNQGGGIADIIQGTGVTAAQPIVLRDSVVDGNTAGSDGGGIFSQAKNDSGSAPGAAITLIRTTVSNNHSGGVGGGIASEGAGTNGTSGVVTLSNSTVSGNTAVTSGGGLQILDTATGTHPTHMLVNATITQNSSTAGGGIDNTGSTTNGGDTITLQNTIVAQNTAAANMGPDLNNNTNGTFTSAGNNLIGVLDAASNFTSTMGDQVGNTTTAVVPLLGPLQDNGGTSVLPDGTHPFTHALLPGSPAIDAGSASLTIDERGFTRPVAGMGTTALTDIGAFEFQNFDVSVAKSVSSPTVSVGDSVTINFKVTNNGPNMSRGVTLSDSVPANVSPQLLTGDTLQGNTLTITVPDLAPNSSTTIQRTFLALGTGMASDTATLSNHDDPTPTNNSSMAAFNVVGATSTVVSPVIVTVGAAGPATVIFPGLGQVANITPLLTLIRLADHHLPSGHVRLRFLVINTSDLTFRGTLALALVGLKRAKVLRRSGVSTRFGFQGKPSPYIAFAGLLPPGSALIVTAPLSRPDFFVPIILAGELREQFQQVV